METKRSLAQVNALYRRCLAETGVRPVVGDGYVYWLSKNGVCGAAESIYTPRLSDYSDERWIECARTAAAQQKEADDEIAEIAARRPARIPGQPIRISL